MKNFQNQRQKILQELHHFVEEKGFILKSASTGYVSIPTYNGKQISPEDYDILEKEAWGIFCERIINGR